MFQELCTGRYLPGAPISFVGAQNPRTTRYTGAAPFSKLLHSSGCKVANIFSNSMVRLAKLALFGTACFALPVRAQDPPPAPVAHATSPNWSSTLTARLSADPTLRFDSRISANRHSLVHADDFGFQSKPATATSPGTINKMEAAFSCNDTPFIDQVRLPFAALWHGRLRLTGFESDVTTANFVLGLPGAGTLNSLSLTGSGHLATHTPPSDQLVGMHLMLSIGGAPVGSVDNSGLHGVEHLARTGRGFLQAILAR
jgi:hypothetical protein